MLDLKLPHYILPLSHIFYPGEHNTVRREREREREREERERESLFWSGDVYYRMCVTMVTHLSMDLDIGLAALFTDKLIADEIIK